MAVTALPAHPACAPDMSVAVRRVTVCASEGLQTHCDVNNCNNDDNHNANDNAIDYNHINKHNNTNIQR